MSFLLFILLILILMVGIPLLRGWFYMQRIRRRVNESFRGRQERSRPEQDAYSEEEYTQNGERKIYTSGDGEYAEFEEVSGTVIEETASTGDDTHTIIEEQVSDAEFEEIP